MDWKLNKFTLTECKNNTAMKGEYYHTKESVDEYTKLAKGYNGSQLIEKLKIYLPKNSSILEIGTGPGSDWKLLNKYYRVVGSDFSAEFLRRLSAKIPDGTFLQLNACTLATDLKFDGLYSNKVLHHLNDLELHMSIKRQHEIINDGGIICHSFWKGEKTECYNGMFVNNHLNEGIEEQFDPFFEILVLENYKEFGTDDSILFIGRKKS